MSYKLQKSSRCCVKNNLKRVKGGIMETNQLQLQEIMLFGPV